MKTLDQKETNIHLQMFVAALLLLEGLAIVIFEKQILPDKFFYDAFTIQQNIKDIHDIPLKFFDSFGNTARFYVLTGIASIANSLVQQMVIYCLSFFFFMAAFFAKRKGINRIMLMMALVWNVPIAIYLGQLCKDILPFAVFSMIVLITINRRLTFMKVLASFALIAVYALFVRQYWLIYLCFIVINSVVLFNIFDMKMLKNRPVKILFLIAIYFLFFMAVNAMTGEPLTSARTDVNQFREGSDSSVTLISNPFRDTGGVTDFLNWLCLLFLLFFPVTIAKSLSALSAIFVVWNLFNVFILCFYFRKLRLVKRPTVKLAKFYYSLILSFTFIQATFEPDLGSFVRHEVVLVPVLLAVIKLLSGLPAVAPSAVPTEERFLIAGRRKPRAGWDSLLADTGGKRFAAKMKVERAGRNSHWYCRDPDW